MDSIREIRNALHVSQWQLAQWLGTTRSALSMAELGLRDLPTPAAVKLFELLQCLQQIVQSPPQLYNQSAESAQQDKLREKLLKQAVALRLQAEQRQLRLNERVEKRARPLRTMEVVNRLRETGNGTLRPGEKIVLDMLEADAIARVGRQTETGIVLAQWQIDNLLSAAENAERLAGSPRAQDGEDAA